MKRSRWICDYCGVDLNEGRDYPEIDLDDIYCFEIGTVDLCHD